MKNLFPVLLSIFFLFANPVFSEAVTVEKNIDYQLSAYIEDLQTDKSLSIQDVIHLNQFKKNQADYYFRGFAKDHFWLKITLKGQNEDQNRFFYITSNLLDIVDFYYPDANGKYQKLVAGDQRPFAEWSEKWSTPSFPVLLKNNQETTFYFHIKSNSVLLFQLELQNIFTHAQSRVYNNVTYGLMLVLCFIYTVFIFFLSKKNSNYNYLFLVPIAILILLFKFLLFGNSFVFLGNNPWIQDRLIVIIIVIFMLLILHYARIYLQLARHQPAMNKIFILQWILTLAGFYILYDTAPILFKLLNANGFIIITLTLIASVRAYNKGQTYVRYFLTIWILVGTGSLLRILTVFGVLPYSVWTIDQLVFQYPVGLLLMLKALYDKYNWFEAEISEYEKKYLDLLNSLQPKKKVSRISGLDIENLTEKIYNLVKEDQLVYDSDFDIKSLANILKIRQDQLSQIFNEVLQTPFKKFLNTIRVHKACEMINKYPEKTITEIFLDCGYANKATFNNAFRDILNTNPVSYKAAISKKI